MNFLCLKGLTRFTLGALLLSSAATFAETESSPAEAALVTEDRAEIGAEQPSDLTGQTQSTKPSSTVTQSSTAAQSPAVGELPDNDAHSSSASTASEQHAPRAESVNLKEVIPELPPAAPPVTEAAVSSISFPVSASSSIAVSETPASSNNEPVVPEAAPVVISSKFILGMEVPPNTAARLVWMPEGVASGLAEQTPVLVVNGKNPGKTLCLTGALHGDELNGIEMIRRIMYQLEPDKLTGTVIGVPVVNLMGFRRNSRYLPDRRDLNRYFPGNTHGSSASRIAYSFFTNIIRHCDALVDLHTGSFHRTNLTQLRADLSNEQVAALAQSFGAIAVLNSRGNSGSLRAAAVRAGIPSVTVEAGEPMRMQSDVVLEGTRAIETLLGKMGMYGRQNKWQRYAPVYYKSVWVRANQSGILFSRAPLGKRVVKGEVLGTVTDPITNASSDILSPYQGRILGMALDQVVLPGFAAYHIGIQTPESILIEEGQLDDDDGDDAFNEPLPDATNDNADLFNKAQNMDDEEE